jgi:hypothetical protein
MIQSKDENKYESCEQVFKLMENQRMELWFKIRARHRANDKYYWKAGILIPAAVCVAWIARGLRFVSSFESCYLGLTTSLKKIFGRKLS